MKRLINPFNPHSRLPYRLQCSASRNENNVVTRLLQFRAEITTNRA
jgi:hypothetical protein